ncbi:MAG TPA: SRPBCC family protein [Chryseosolibacter sp.]
MAISSKLSPSAERELVMVRTFNAPRKLVFEVWTDPKHLDAWWGPKGFTNVTKEMDVRPGGVWRYMMHGPDGVDYPNRITFIEVVKPEKLLFTHGDDIDNDPNAFTTTVIFREIGRDKTEITMTQVFNTKEQRDMLVEQFGAIEAGKQTMDKLVQYLAKLV